MGINESSKEASDLLGKEMSTQLDMCLHTPL